ncbi:hypothetical protein SB758_43200, partial [Burkholderia sp. SIMBA_013]
DGLGQDVGNLLLRAVALRLTDQLGDKVVVSRISADVFGIYGPANIVTPNAFSELFALPFRAGEHYIPLRVTCGFAS